MGSDVGSASIAIDKINQFFKKERDFKDLNKDERKKRRNLELAPLIDGFYRWLETLSPSPKSNLGKAVIYARNQKEALLRVLEDGRLQLSNNICEHLIRPIAIGRKNHLFSTSEKGATANVIAYTLINTAKINGLKPYKYLTYLFTHLPNTDFMRKPELLDAFLQWNDSIQQLCR